MSRGLRNNNPGNIRVNKEKFQGEIQPSKDRAFKQFVSMAYGYRAVFVILHTYLAKEGVNTVDAIIRRWAPPEDNNDTSGYIRQVEKLSGVGRMKKLDASSGTDYIKIVAAISRVENGVPADLLEVEEGFSLQNKLKL